MDLEQLQKLDENTALQMANVSGMLSWAQQFSRNRLNQITGILPSGLVSKTVTCTVCTEMLLLAAVVAITV